MGMGWEWESFFSSGNSHGNSHGNSAGILWGSVGFLEMEYIITEPISTTHELKIRC